MNGLAHVGGLLLGPDLAEPDPVTGSVDRRGRDGAVAVGEARSDRSGGACAACRPVAAEPLPTAPLARGENGSAVAEAPALTLVPPTPTRTGTAAGPPGTSSSVAARRTLMLALHRAGGLSAGQLVDLQLSDVVEHPAGLLVSAAGPPGSTGRERRFGLGRQPGGDCPVQAFEAWRGLLERAFLAGHHRRMQPADRSAQPLFRVVGSGGRPTQARVSVHAAARVLLADADRALGDPLDLAGHPATRPGQPAQGRHELRVAGPVGS